MSVKTASTGESHWQPSDSEHTSLKASIEYDSLPVAGSFFESLVCQLAKELGVRYVFVARLDSTGLRGRTEALWMGGSLADPLEYVVAGTPCENVVRPSVVFHPDHVQERYPEDQLLVEMGAQSYLGAPLVSSGGAVLGVLAALNDQPMQECPGLRATMKNAAARAAAELERMLASEDLTDALRRKCEQSESYLEAILENTSFLIGLISPEGIVLRANSAVCESAGIKEADLLGRHIWDGPDWPSDQVRSQIRDAVRLASQGMSQRLEVPRYQKDGKIGVIEFSISPIRNRDGKIMMLVPEGKDITERKRMEEILKTSEERFRRLVSEIDPDYIVYSHDTSGRLHFISKSSEQLLGIPVEQMIGRTWRELFSKFMPDDGLLNVEEADAIVIGGEPPDPYEVTLQIPGGPPVIIEIRDHPVCDASGKVIAIEGVAHNITEFRKTEAELTDAKERAESADHVKSAFLASISHEFRTPLNSIIGFTGILLQELVGALNDEQRKQLGMVQRSSRHLLRLVNDILDISRIEAGKLSIYCEEFELGDVTDGVLEIVRPQAVEKGLRLESEIGSEIATITTDKCRFEQVLINLFNNAIKFTDAGSVRLRCQMSADRPDWLTVSISDTGIGIKDKDQAELFQPFRQIMTEADRHRGGSGLGLAISYRLVELLGGELSVESEWGKGSTFTIILPVRPSINASKGNNRNPWLATMA